MNSISQRMARTGQVWFPWIAVALLWVGSWCAVSNRAGAAEALAAAPATPARKTLVVLGDSLAAGYGVDPSQAFPAVLQAQIQAAGLGFTVINAGVSGDTSAGALRRLDWILRRPVDVLLLEIGGNDGLRGQSTGALKTNLVAIIERTRKKYPDAQVILSGMKMPPNMGSYAVDFARVFADVARDQNVTLVPFLLEGVGGVPDLNLPDGIHPTPEGHQKIAQTLFAVIRPLLEKASTVAPPRAP